MKRRCAVCRNGARKLTTVYLRADGALRRGRLCKSCLGDTVRIHIAKALPSLCACGSEAAFCHKCARKAIVAPSKKFTKAIASKLRRIAGAYENDGTENEAHIDGLLQAAGIVEAFDVRMLKHPPTDTGGAK